MPDSTNLLMLEFLSWVADRRRSYDEAMEAWQSHCPRQTIWEDAIIDGYVQLSSVDAIYGSEVTLTPRGRELLEKKHNHG